MAVPYHFKTEQQKLRRTYCRYSVVQDEQIEQMLCLAVGLAKIVVNVSFGLPLSFHGIARKYFAKCRTIKMYREKDLKNFYLWTRWTVAALGRLRDWFSFSFSFCDGVNFILAQSRWERIVIMANIPLSICIGTLDNPWQSMCCGLPKHVSWVISRELDPPSRIQHVDSRCPTR